MMPKRAISIILNLLKTSMCVCDLIFDDDSDANRVTGVCCVISEDRVNTNLSHTHTHTQSDEISLTWSHNNTPLTHTVIIHYRETETETTHTHTHNHTSLTHTHKSRHLSHVNHPFSSCGDFSQAFMPGRISPCRELLTDSVCVCVCVCVTVKRSEHYSRLLSTPFSLLTVCLLCLLYIFNLERVFCVKLANKREAICVIFHCKNIFPD